MLLHFVQQSLDFSFILAAIFLDVTRAFDSLTHIILIGKLSHQGVHGEALSWFSSFLTDQSIVVETFDEHIPVEYGVPQGSVLGLSLLSLLNPVKDIHTLHLSSIAFQYFCWDLLSSLSGLLEIVRNVSPYETRNQGWCASAIHPCSAFGLCSNSCCQTCLELYPC